jgi:hypothetical protein
MDGRDPGEPVVCLGDLADDSVAVSMYVLVRHAVRQRPELATAMRGSVRLRFAEGYAPVRIDFRGDEVEVADVDADDRAHDLEISGRLGDVNALLIAPLVGGLPSPATRHGRGAIARLADGRVDVHGPLTLARNLLRLLTVDGVSASRTRHVAGT